jgi:hypothetical protein
MSSRLQNPFADVGLEHRGIHFEAFGTKLLSGAIDQLVPRLYLVLQLRGIGCRHLGRCRYGERCNGMQDPYVGISRTDL